MWWTVTGGVLVGKKGNLSSYEDDASMQTMLSVAFGPVSLTFIISIILVCLLYWFSFFPFLLVRVFTDCLFTLE